MWLSPGGYVEKEQTVQMLLSALTVRSNLYRAENWDDVFAPTCANVAHHQFSGQLICGIRYSVRVS